MVENVDAGRKIDEGVELRNYSDGEGEKPPKPKTTIPKAARRTGQKTSI